MTAMDCSLQTGPMRCWDCEGRKLWCREMVVHWRGCAFAPLMTTALLNKAIIVDLEKSTNRLECAGRLNPWKLMIRFISVPLPLRIKDVNVSQ